MGKQQMVVGSIRLKAELWEEIREVAQRLKSRPSEVMRTALALGLEQLYPKETPKRRRHES